MHIVMYGGEGQLLKPLHRRDACSSLMIIMVTLVTVTLATVAGP